MSMTRRTPCAELQRGINAHDPQRGTFLIFVSARTTAEYHERRMRRDIARVNVDSAMPRLTAIPRSGD